MIEKESGDHQRAHVEITLLKYKSIRRDSGSCTNAGTNAVRVHRYRKQIRWRTTLDHLQFKP